MLISRAPFRISLFGGSTDYRDFYREHGSLLVGTTINQYFYTSVRVRPPLLGTKSIISYSKHEIVPNHEHIENPLIRETLKYFNVNKPIELRMFADIPSRTGLGGSSACCVTMAHIFNTLLGIPTTKKALALDAIQIERDRLQEPGGIQDQIWAAYGGLNTIEIERDGDFRVRPIDVSEEFKHELDTSMVLVYTGGVRADGTAKSHENKDKTAILDLTRSGLWAIRNEKIKDVGRVLWDSWEEKKKISEHISSPKIDEMVMEMKRLGFYGVKLLGSGGSGFLLGIAHPKAIKKCKETFEGLTLDFRMSDEGSQLILDL